MTKIRMDICFVCFAHVPGGRPRRGPASARAASAGWRSAGRRQPPDSSEEISLFEPDLGEQSSDVVSQIFVAQGAIRKAPLTLLYFSVKDASTISLLAGRTGPRPQPDPLHFSVWPGDVAIKRDPRGGNYFSHTLLLQVSVYQTEIVCTIQRGVVLYKNGICSGRLFCRIWAGVCPMRYFSERVRCG
jgi:hypothetical protein